MCLSLIVLTVAVGGPTRSSGIPEGAGLGVLVEHLSRPSEIGVIVPGLSVFLLSVYFEFKGELGEVTRCVSHLPRSFRDGSNIDIIRTS